jgi:drug/metabolite transporter (DMT)-like permease
MIYLKFNKSIGLLLLAAAIWGFAFVAQRAGMEHIGPYTFNGIRFALGSITLLPFISIIKIKRTDTELYQSRHLLTGGLLSGLVLFAGASFQQVGIVITTAGNAGFITSLYVIIVPVLGLIWGHKINFQTWFGVIFAIIGLYLLSVNDKFDLSRGDGIILIGSICFAFHVMIIGWFTLKVNPIKMSIIQFTICAILSLAVALINEEITLQGIKLAAVPLLYGGIFSVGIAFTLQVIGQRKAKPSHTAIVLSLESLFAAAGGWLILNEGFTTRGFVGCGLMLTGIIFSQIKTEPKLTGTKS